MAENKEQKTQLLTDTPPEVQAALDRQRPAAGAQPSGQATMMLDAPAPAARAAAPAAAPARAAAAPRAAAPPTRPSAARWVIGPVLSVVVGVGTAALAGKLLPPPAPPPPPPKVMGKLQVTTNPSGASVTIDGKPFPHFTPTSLDGEVGSSVTIGFKLDGYQAKEMEVAFVAGDHPIDVTLDKVKEAPPVAPPVAPPTVPVPTAPTADAGKHEHEHHGGSSTKGAAKETGTGTLSVSVRPWAIVFVDEKKLKQTPVQAFPLPAGKHTVELVNDGKGKHEKIPIVIKANDAQEIRRDWDNN